MNTQDEQAWEREFDHVEEKQRCKEVVTFAGGKTYEVPVKEQDDEK